MYTNGKAATAARLNVEVATVVARPFNIAWKTKKLFAESDQKRRSTFSIRSGYIKNLCNSTDAKI